jgi:hypothetical protein
VASKAIVPSVNSKSQEKQRNTYSLPIQDGLPFNLISETTAQIDTSIEEASTNRRDIRGTLTIRKIDLMMLYLLRVENGSMK